VQRASDSTSTDQGRALESFPLPSLGAVVDGRYRITRCIGSGGMGAVYEAEQLSVGRRCALKFLRAELAGGSRNTARFQRESRLLGSLEHEHLTAVLDAGTYLGKSPYLVMEYLDGRTLKQVLSDEGALAVEMTVELMLQVCRGMAHVHARGIVHRDLKPANLMIGTRSTGGPWLKILDFGIARESNAAREQLTPSGADLGTAQYMSPEQARGAKDLDCRSDIYALGAILYEALTGCRLHVGDSYNAVIFNLLTQPHRPLEQLMPACPPGLVAIVERCLQNEPTRRFANAGELGEALEGLSLVPATDKRPSPTNTSGSVRTEWSAARRRYAWTACLLTGSLIGALVTLGAGSLYEPGSPASNHRVGEPLVENASSLTVPARVPNEDLAVQVVPELPIARPAEQPDSALAVIGEEKPTAATNENPAPMGGTRIGKGPDGAIGGTPSKKGSTASHVESVVSDSPPVQRNEHHIPLSIPVDERPDGDVPAQSSAVPNLPAGDPFPFVTSNPYGAN
jgi:serine/threonine protein kinase